MTKLNTIPHLLLVFHKSFFLSLLFVITLHIFQYQVEISNRFAATVNLDESMDINNASESIRDNIRTSAKENIGYQG